MEIYLPEIMAVLIFVGGAAVYFIANSIENIQKKLKDKGRGMTAVIKSYGYSNKRLGYHYNYKNSNNEVFEGFFQSSDKDKYQIEDKISGYYDAEKNSKSMVVNETSSKDRLVKILRGIAIFEMTLMPIIVYYILSQIL